MVHNERFCMHRAHRGNLRIMSRVVSQSNFVSVPPTAVRIEKGVLEFL